MRQEMKDNSKRVECGSGDFVKFEDVLNLVIAYSGCFTSNTALTGMLKDLNKLNKFSVPSAPENITINIIAESEKVDGILKSVGKNIEEGGNNFKVVNKSYNK